MMCTNYVRFLEAATGNCRLKEWVVESSCSFWAACEDCKKILKPGP